MFTELAVFVWSFFLCACMLLRYINMQTLIILMQHLTAPKSSKFRLNLDLQIGNSPHPLGTIFVAYLMYYFRASH